MTDLRALTFRTQPSLHELTEFLQRIDADVVPPLSSRVQVEEYAEKLNRIADCIVADIDHRVVGLCAMYCNDQATREGFISLIAVDAQLRRIGLGASLLEKGLELALSKGMERVLLETHVANHKAISLYRSKDFTVSKVHPDGSLFMSRDLQQYFALAG
jgi:ribosomal protein S18 acetylase RimI-like enzyme